MDTFFRGLSFALTLALGPAVFLSNVAVAESREGHLTLGTASIHYGVYDTETEARGDVLYLHGFGDRFENHLPLFEQFNQVGMRVIALDLPSHGLTTGAPADDLNKQNFDGLVAIVSQVLKSQREGGDVNSSAKPLLLAGWSLGGLLATRIVQDESYRAQFPKIAGLILYAPSLAPKPCVGSFFCQISNATLTHDTLLQAREIMPKSPLNYLAFDARLVLAAAKGWKNPMPADLSTLVFVADASDRYVFSNKIYDWVKLQRAAFISRMPAYACKGARHELDNETPEFGGTVVREISAEFAAVMARGEFWDPKLQGPTSPCAAF